MLPYMYLLPIIVLFSVLLVYPMITVVRYALMDNVITNRNPQFVGFANFVRILSDETFWTALWNTVVFTVVSVFFHLVLGMCFALLLNSEQINRHARSVCRALYILPWTFTVAIVAIIWRLLLNPSGVINFIINAGVPIEWFGSSKTALGAIIFVNIWAGYPFYMVSFLAGLQGIPKDLYEAATIDGANAVDKFRYITIPQLKPVIISMLMLDFIWTMQQLSLVWMTTGGGPVRASEVMGTYTYKLAFLNMKFSMASASAIIILVICMVIGFFYVRYQTQRGD